MNSATNINDMSVRMTLETYRLVCQVVDELHRWVSESNGRFTMTDSEVVHFVADTLAEFGLSEDILNRVSGGFVLAMYNGWDVRVENDAIIKAAIKAVYAATYKSGSSSDH